MFVISQKMPIMRQMSNLVPFWAKITHFDISGSTRTISLKLCSIIWYYKRAKVMFLKFPKKYLLGSNGQSRPFWGKIMQFFISGLPLRIFSNFAAKLAIVRGKKMAYFLKILIFWDFHKEGFWTPPTPPSKVCETQIVYISSLY